MRRFLRPCKQNFGRHLLRPGSGEGVADDDELGDDDVDDDELDDDDVDDDEQDGDDVSDDGDDEDDDGMCSLFLFRGAPPQNDDMSKMMMRWAIYIIIVVPFGLVFVCLRTTTRSS